MNLQAIFNVAGILLVLLSGLILVPLGVSLYYDAPALEGYMSATQAFSWTLVASIVTGLILWRLLPSGVEKLRDREGFAIVAISWLFIALFGSIPFYLTGVCPNFIDAFFESMS